MLFIFIQLILAYYYINKQTIVFFPFYHFLHALILTLLHGLYLVRIFHMRMYLQRLCSWFHHGVRSMLKSSSIEFRLRHRRHRYHSLCLPTMISYSVLLSEIWSNLSNIPSSLSIQHITLMTTTKINAIYSNQNFLISWLMQGSHLAYKSVQTVITIEFG